MTRTSRAALFALAFGPCTAAQAQDSPPSAPPTASLPAIVVTGKPLADLAKEEAKAEQAVTPGGVTLVDTEELRRRNATSLADLLRYVPGVWAASGSTGDSAFLSIRGSNLDATAYDGNGIKLLQDGLPVTAADGNNHNRAVDPLSARHAIVARGANALTYGASTLGGAIDFITPTARDGAPNEVLVNAGSHGQRQGRLTWGTVADAFDALITVEGKRSDGYREHQQQERAGLYANAGWEFSNAVRTRFYATAIDNDQQLPGALTRDEWRADRRQAQGAAVRGDYQYNVKTRRLANKTTWDIDADRSLTAGVSYEEQQLYHPIVYAPPFFSLLIDTEQRNWGGTLRYQHRIGAHDLLAGLNYGRTTVTGGNYSYEPDGPRARFADVDNHADSLEVFVTDRWAFTPGWTVVYGAQAVSGSREIRSAGLEGDFDSVNPRLGLIHQWTPTVQLFANLSRVYEAPTLYELEDQAPGGEPGTMLDPMSGTVFEIGSRGTQALGGGNQWNWDVAIYYTRLRNEILSRDSPLAPGTSLAINADRTVHAGIEALAGASFALDDARMHRIEPLLNLTVNHFRFRNDAVYGNNELPAAPRFALKGELTYRHANGFFAGPTLDVIGRRYADFSNTYKVDGYTLWGLRGGYTSKSWEVFGEVRNLADRNHVSSFNVKDQADTDAAILTPGEPRSIYVGARFKF